MRRRSSDTLVDQPPRKRAHLNRHLPDGIRCDDILTDVHKKQWRLGGSIGAGAFGQIYLVSDVLKDPVKADAAYVAKIEPHENGPLFVEMNCYLRAAKLEQVQSWLQEKDIHEIGMPHYISSGSHVTSNGKYRFLILPRYGNDIDSIFKIKNKRFSTKTVLTISIQILDILEYLHSKGYVHCDIKGSNVLLGYQHNNYSGLVAANKAKLMRQKVNRNCELCNKKHSNCLTCKKRHENHENTDHAFTYKREQSANQVYLLDYGLASKFLNSTGEHKEYCDDARKAHAGTIQFCSRDAHSGCTARRSDLENLGYNMLYWLSSKLPWDDITDPEIVKNLKSDAMSNLETFIYSVLGDSFPSCIYEYLKYVRKLSFQQQPDYDFCRKLFCKGLLECGYKNDNRIDFDRAVSCDKVTKKFNMKKVKIQSENIRNKKQIQPNFMFDRKPLGINSQVMIVRKPTLRSAETRKLRKNKFNWAKVLSSDPEVLMRQNKKPVEPVNSKKHSESSETEGNVMNINLSRLNPTYAMIDVVNRAQERYNAAINNNIPANKGRGDCCPDKHEGYTPAMELVLKRRKARKQEQAMLKGFGITISQIKDRPQFSPRHTRSKGRHPFTRNADTRSKCRSKSGFGKKARLSLVVNKRSCYSLRG